MIGYVVEKVFYGETLLIRGYCKKCHQVSFIIDGYFSCCGNAAPFPTKINYRREATTTKRMYCPKKIKEQLLIKQFNRCIWCGYEFTDILYNYKTDKTCVLEPIYDHKIPFSYSGNLLDNWVAACSICNGIKSNKYFPNYKEAYQFIGKRRIQNGWTSGYYYEEDLIKAIIV
jgi:hypothetical protein